MQQETENMASSQSTKTTTYSCYFDKFPLWNSDGVMFITHPHFFETSPDNIWTNVLTISFYKQSGIYL